MNVYEEQLRAHGVCGAALSLFTRFAGRILPELFFAPDGIHGMGHARRVLFYAMLIADHEKISLEDQRLAAAMAVYHDIGRVDDSYDLRHGVLSWKKASGLRLLEDFSPVAQEQIRFCIENHCGRIPITQYDLPPALHPATLRLRKILKDADGLDRWRFGADSVDPRYMRTATARWIFAHQDDFYPILYTL